MTEQSQKSTDFSATDSALGYFYQVRVALVSSLQRLKKGEVFSTYLETLDDVVFTPSDAAPDLVQLKHHGDSSINLTDASSDLWKSLRVWIQGRIDGNIPADSRLYLMTTSRMSSRSSSAVYLTSDNRNELEAIKGLESTATTSSSETNAEAYRLFLNLNHGERVALATSIQIITESPTIGDIEQFLRTEAGVWTRSQHVNHFASQLEGWWYRRVVKQMIDPDTPPISSREIDNKIQDLRDQYGRNTLPVDEDILISRVERDSYEQYIFVQQAKLAGIGSKRIFRAIQDYYRAYTQRSLWIRESLLNIDELDRYELLLKDEWELQFERLVDDMGEEAAEDVRQQVAKEIYAWVEDKLLHIRKEVTHPSISRGSFHILSDSLKVGWHPDFMSRLQHLLEPQEV